MKLAIYGAGAVGLTLGTRLAQAGNEVLFVVRRAEVAKCIASEGVSVEDPASGQRFRVSAPVAAGIEAAAARIGDGPVLFCMRGPHVEEAGAALVRVAPDALVASLQNDVHHEEILARRFPRVLGVVVRQTCTRTRPNATVALGGGRLVVGAFPEGGGADVEELAGMLRNAAYDVGVSPRIREDKWLKLCVNLMSAPNALVRRDDHDTRAFVEVKARLLEEARVILDAAGIAARSCDGRDRSLDREIAHQRESLTRGTSARRLPVYNQVWATLRHGGPLEADAYHRRILALAAAQKIPAPTNERVLAALERAASQSFGPECMGAAELLGEA